MIKLQRTIRKFLIFKRTKCNREAQSMAMSNNNTMEAPTSQFFKKNNLNNVNNSKIIEAEVKRGTNKNIN